MKIENTRLFTILVLAVVLCAAGGTGCPRPREVAKPDPAPPEATPRARVPPDGPHVEWWGQPRGKKQVVGAHLKGRRHGRWTWWYRTGQKRLQVIYVHGITHGPVTGWHPSGKLRHQGQYVRGKKVGEWKSFRPDGGLSKRCSYRPDGNNTCTRIFEFEADLIESHCAPVPRRR